MNTFSVYSLGCKVNDYESNYVIEELKKDFKYIDHDLKADIYVIFSCCVTNVAEQKTRKVINKIKRLNEDSFICVIGCYPQTKPNAPIFDNVDLLIGTKFKNQIPRLIKERYKGKLIEDSNNLKFESMFIKNYSNKSRAFLKIQDGCNQYCTYCVIPYARGNERSESHEKILQIAAELSKKYKEIVLTGIHTGRYNDNGYNLYNLLSDLVKINEIKTIRLSSIELNELSDEIIELMSKNSKIAHHLHIPIQSLNDQILKNMHRTYSLYDYKERLKYIRNKINNISISTDLIVGFPNESEETFNTFFKELDDIKFSFIHVFPYSKKDGTLASTYLPQIEKNEKKNRVNKIISYQKKYFDEYRQKFIGKFVDVLVETIDDTFSYGYSKNYMYIKFKGIKKIGDIYRIKVLKIENNIIVGEYVS